MGEHSNGSRESASTSVLGTAGFGGNSPAHSRCRGLIISIYQCPIQLIALHHRCGAFHGSQDAQNTPDSFLQSAKLGQTPKILSSLDCISVANVTANARDEGGTDECILTRSVKSFFNVQINYWGRGGFECHGSRSEP